MPPGPPDGGTSQSAFPYKFLDSYGERDHGLFFGRDREVKLLLADVMVQPLVVLFAKTGTGKTSLINAGVRPLLDARGYESFYIRVHRDPTQSALAAIQRQLGRPLPAGDSLAERLDKLGRQRGKPVVLFFDQFEEFFLYAVRDDYQSARRFVSELAEIHRGGSLARVVLSMREEFFVELDMFRDEIPDIFHEDSNLRLRWFHPEQAVHAIERPAQAFGVGVEPELVEALIRDLTDSGRTVLGATPFKQIEPAQLQIVCDTLWRRRSGDRLTLELYRALGTEGADGSIAQQILERRLYEEFEQLDSREHLDLLVQLLPLLKTDRGTKRVWDVSSLRQELGGADEILRDLLERLSQAYLVQLSSHEDSDVVELTHDYFVERLDELTEAASRVWPRRRLRETLGRGELLDVNTLVRIGKLGDGLALTEAEGTLVLDSVVVQRTKLQDVIGPVLASGVDLWQQLRQRLAASDDDGKTAYLLDTLAGIERPEAHRVLQWALQEDDGAWTRLEALARRGTPEALAVLHVALQRGWLARRPISRLPLEATVGTVAFFEAALVREESADEARGALRTLAGSSDPPLAEAARSALGDPAVAPLDPISDWPAGDVVRGEPGGLVDILERHLRRVAMEIGSGRVVPFLGAGVNLCGRPEELTWHPGQFDWLPSTRELSIYLAQMFGYEGRDEDDLARVSQYVALTVGAWPLYEELRRLFDDDYPPTVLHNFLAEIPSILRDQGAPRPYPLIVTANYDDVLERAFRDAGEPFDLVTYDAEGQFRGKFTHHAHDGRSTTIYEPNVYFDLTTDDRTIILKLFGSVDRIDPGRDSYVITEDHFIDYLARTDVSKLFPVTLVEKLRRSHCLFLGYNLRDWRLRVILNRIWGDETLRSKSWAVQLSPEPVDEGLWRSRDVMIMDVPLEEYVLGLRDELLAREGGR
jgi:SIR2-like domain